MVIGDTLFHSFIYTFLVVLEKKKEMYYLGSLCGNLEHLRKKKSNDDDG